MLEGPTQTERTCSECGSVIPDTVAIDHCPACLIQLALTNVDGKSMASLEPGETFGDYELLELLGEGGMGMVYRARQKTLNRRVAIKLMRSSSFGAAEDLRRFRSEARAAAQLTHPNIIPIYEVGEENGRPYFTMELVEGNNLAQIIRRTPLAPDLAARQVRTIAQAVHYAHEQGILHRDLKPANVLVDRSGCIRVTDFGLAKLLQARAMDSMTATKSGAVLGTPSYMPPEQARGKETSPRSDVYSIGAILYDCLTGRPPFRADTALDTLRQVIEMEPVSPCLLNPKVPRDLETICLKCLAKAPEQRYATAQEVAEDLDRYLSQCPILARPVGFLERCWRWSRRNPLAARFWIAMAGLLVLLACGGILQRRTALVGVKESAWMTSRLVEDELQPVKESVQALSADAELARQIVRQDTNALRALLSANLEKHQARAPRWLRLQNWVVMTPAGSLVFRWPDAGVRSIRERSVRDYYHGATNSALRRGDVYLSRGYQSAEDDGYKFALSAPVFDEEQKLAGVLSLMVSPTDLVREVLGPRTSGREVVLVAEWDSSKPASTPSEQVPIQGRDFQIVYHPAFGTNNLAIPINHHLLDSTAEELAGDSLYRDPLAARHPKYGGWWLAGFSRVPDSKLMVIYQMRDWLVDALAAALAMAGLICGAFAIVWRVKRRQRISSVDPRHAPPEVHLQ
jgi:serine/threonine-protein kinase